MFVFNFLIQAFRVLVWGVVLAGCILILRRGYATAAVSMLLGAAIMTLMGVLQLVIAIPAVFTSVQGTGPARIMMTAQLIATVYLFLFALGLVQLARTIKREG